MLVQIYGLTTPEDAATVRELGPDHAGVVLDEGIDTWDSVDEATAARIVQELQGVTVVALSLSTERERILKTVATVRPAILHLARAADGLSPEHLRELRLQIAPVRLMVTIPVRGADAIETARRFAPYADFLLADTAHPNTGVVGATGFVHDWDITARVVQAVDIPVLLAGGLGPENVVAAIERVRPAGVDSETRTSRPDDRRRKDSEKVRRFIERARSVPPS